MNLLYLLLISPISILTSYEVDEKKHDFNETDFLPTLLHLYENTVDSRYLEVEGTL